MQIVKKVFNFLYLHCVGDVVVGARVGPARLLVPGAQFNRSFEFLTLKKIFYIKLD